MWAQNILLAVIGLSAGVIVANGLFSFVIELGVVSDLADRTHTGEHILLYEDSVALGGILANIFWVFHISIPGGNILAAVFRPAPHCPRRAKCVRLCGCGLQDRTQHLIQ